MFTGKTRGLLQMRFDRFEVHEDLPLVVGRSARVDFAVANRGFKRRRLPEIERVDGLDVVVTVEEDRRSTGCVHPVAVDDRIAGCVDQADMLHPDPGHLVRAPLRAALHVACVFRKGTDAGNRQQRLRSSSEIACSRLTLMKSMTLSICPMLRSGGGVKSSSDRRLRSRCRRS